MRGRDTSVPRANFTSRGLAVVTGRYRNCMKISISLRTFLKRCKSACGCTNVPPARICISEPRTGQVDIRDQQSAHSRVHSMSYRRQSARGGCDTGVRRAGLVVSSHVFRRVSNIYGGGHTGRERAAAKLKCLQFTGTTVRPGHTRYIGHPFVLRIILATLTTTIQHLRLRPSHVCVAGDLFAAAHTAW